MELKKYKLSELINLEIGEQLNVKKMNDSFQYPVFNGGKKPSGYWKDFNVTENTISISQGGASAGFVEWHKEKYWAGAHCYWITVKNNLVLIKYLFYFFKNKEKDLMKAQHGAGIPALYRSDILDLEINLPDIKTQQKIVTILDSFTELTTELTTELENRVKQFNYFLENSLSFNEQNLFLKKYNKSEWLLNKCHINKICHVLTGGDHPLDYSDIKTDEYCYPILSNGTQDKAIWGYAKTYRVNKSAITYSARGTVGYTMIWTTPFTPIIRLNVLIPKDNNQLDLYFLKYSLDFNKIDYYKSAVPNINSQMLGQLRINLPSIKIQKLIGKFLNLLDSYINDLKCGLPAEIALRQKQYEYYREKLLNFDSDSFKL